MIEVPEYYQNRIPHDTLKQMIDYAERRVPVGGFLYAVFSNNLEVACLKADDANYRSLKAIVAFAFTMCPIPCRGGGDTVEIWLGRKKPPDEE